MNKKTKIKLIKQLNRQLSGKACQFYLFGNSNCRKAFMYRLSQFAGDKVKCVPDIDDWILLAPKQ